MDKLSFNQVGVGFAFFLLILQTVALLMTVANIRRQAKREDDFATKAEIGKVDTKLESFKAEVIRNGDVRKQQIEQKVESARCEARESAAELHEKINGVKEDV